MYIYKIAANTPFNNSILTYKSDDVYKPGDLIKIPLGKREVMGCVLNTEPASDLIEQKFELKEVIGRFEPFREIPESHLAFMSWVAKYYHYPLGQHLSDTLPKPLKRPKEVTKIIGSHKEFNYELTTEQKDASKRIMEKLGSFSRFLIHGVTGSGKTTIYLHLFLEVLKQGKSALFMVPEINLTPQFIKIISEHMPGEILTYHSSMSQSEKNYVWHRVKEESPYILIGVRSSIFLPFKNLGLIVIDEEHDNSFKQEDRCPYNARDVASKLAHLSNFPIVMGSATPTIDTLYSIRNTENYIKLEKRATGLEMPNIEIIDGRTKSVQDGDIWPFTSESMKEIENRLNNNEQVLVFVNRLGFASFVQCKACGKDFSCLNCSTTLKYFKKSHALKCQFCDFQIPYPDGCPDCGNMNLLQKGFGTEKLASVLTTKFPNSKIGRFDRDAVKTFSELKTVLNDFENEKIDILVGTQMLSKGHNFKKVNLVVLLGIDSQLNFPDFRSNERVFQLVTQTAGRPGRTEKKGLVYIESLSPENQIFKRIKDYDEESFYNEEIELRKMLDNPPFSRMVAIYITSRFANKAEEEARLLAKLVFQLLNTFKEVELLGPRPAIIEKRANKFTWTLLLKSNNINDLHNVVENIKTHHKIGSGNSLKIDVDPYHLA